ncbi:MAG: 2-oxo acid dehydrogenase subunit E2 [Syntrophaceae bacterium]|nr:2-oxo acid dehydrogenase subunit E2 [Syntrophaceae bacterium]
MAVEILMPGLGLSISEGTVERWLKKEGDRVEKGELLAVILTEKVTLDLPAEASGILLRIIYPAGSKVKVGEIIAIIGDAGESLGSDLKAEHPSLPSSIHPSSTPLSFQDRGDLKISPLAIRIASEHGVDPREVAAEFPGKKIGKDQVLAFLETRKRAGKAPSTPLSPPAQPEDEVRLLRGPMRAMAEHMARSAQTAARVTTMAEVDMAEMVKLRLALKEKFQKEYQVNLTFVPFVMKAMVEGVKEFPILNASLRGEEIILHRQVNIGIAVDTGESLLVPAVRDVATKTIVDLSGEISQLSSKAREGKLSLADIQGGTITLTNAGVYGALLATPLIHQPQSAILWMGKVMDTPVAREGQVVIRPMMYLCLSYDHRIVMGAQAIRFLQAVKKNLENPYPLLV